MALSITDKTNVEAPNAKYPYGQIKDESVSGANDGTPISRAVYGDFHQFFAKLMDEAGITANSLPDNEDNGYQLFDAFKQWIIKLGQDELTDKYNPMYLSNGLRTGNIAIKNHVEEIGDWNMDATSLSPILNPVDYTKIRSISCVIRSDDNQTYYSDNYRGSTGTPTSEPELWFTNLSSGGFRVVRKNGGAFDSTFYNSTGFNRGWVFITYEA